MKGSGSKRLALVVGNSAYSSAAALPNAANDARAMGRKLAELGFEVMGGAEPEPASGGKARDTGSNVGINLDRKASVRQFTAFLDRIKSGDTAFIFYAGHGLQIADENYLVPVDASLAGSEPLTQLIRMRVMIEQVASKAGRAGTTMVFLDACRENPFSDEQLRNLADGARAVGDAYNRPDAMGLVGKGFATMKMRTRDGYSATFISFATAPGDYAYDGEGDNSPFTTAVLQHMGTRGLSLDDFIDRVATDVIARSEKAGRFQDPWYETNLRQNFYFKPADPTPIYVLALLSLLAGALSTHLMMGFDSFMAVLKPDHPKSTLWLYLSGLPFAAVVAFGVWQWGSRKIRDIAIAFLGTTFGFALAMFILATPIKQQKVAGSLLVIEPFSISSILARDRLQAFLDNPHYVAVSVLVLLAALLATMITSVSLKTQRGGFKGFGAFVGSMSIGVALPFLVVAMLWAREIMKLEGNEPLHWMAVGTGALWFMIFGAQLGYCFMFHVPDHEELK